MSDKKTVIAVDFDGTIAKTEYPEIIEPIQNTIDYIQLMKSKGATIILWTCREGKELEEAVNWCKENNVPIDYINENDPERIATWGNDCRKIGADIYIDDKAITDSQINMALLFNNYQTEVVPTDTDMLINAILDMNEKM